MISILCFIQLGNPSNLSFCLEARLKLLRVKRKDKELLTFLLFLHIYLFKLFDVNNGYHKTQNMSKAALKLDLMMLLLYIPFNTHILSCVLQIK